MSWEEVACALGWLREFGAHEPAAWRFALESHHLLRDRQVDTGPKKRSSLLGLVDSSLTALFEDLPELAGAPSTVDAYRLNWHNQASLCAPAGPTSILVMAWLFHQKAKPALPACWKLLSAWDGNAFSLTTGTAAVSPPVDSGQIPTAFAWICTAMWVITAPLAWMGRKSSCMATDRISLARSCAVAAW
jgi:hypothetical protein